MVPSPPTGGPDAGGLRWDAVADDEVTEGVTDGAMLDEIYDVVTGLRKQLRGVVQALMILSALVASIGVFLLVNRTRDDARDQARKEVACLVQNVDC